MACLVLNKQAILLTFLLNVVLSLFSYLQRRGSGTNNQPKSNNSNKELPVSLGVIDFFQKFQKKKETGLLGYSCHEGIKRKEFLTLKLFQRWSPALTRMFTRALRRCVHCE